MLAAIVSASVSVNCHFCKNPTHLKYLILAILPRGMGGGCSSPTELCIVTSQRSFSKCIVKLRRFFDRKQTECSQNKETLRVQA